MNAGKALLRLVLFGLATSALAAPPNQATLDGRPLEYDATDLRGSYTGGGGVFGAGTYITNLYVTWDTNYLYLALQGAEVNDKLVIMLDVDPGLGTGATTTTNWANVEPSYIKYNDPGWRAADGGGATNFGLDFQIASEGFYNNIVGILYDGVATPDTTNTVSLFDSGNGATPLGTPVDMAVYADATTCDQEGIEARIPWSVLYPTNNRFGTVLAGDIVPMGATLRLFATIHNNDPSLSYNSNDAIPQQTSGNASWSAGLLTSDNYIDLIVDVDNDGHPDVAAGDVNAPYLRYASGVQGQRQLFALMSEDLNATTATDVNNWLIGVDSPGSATMVGTNGVLLDLTNDLPIAGTPIQVSAVGVKDPTGNDRTTYVCFSPSASGLTNALTVRFVLETDSGLGVSPGATNFFVNGGSFPLEFGFPAATSSPLDLLSGTLYYRDVIFPPGTPQTLNYKYSGIILGTNNYEAVRLSDYASAARRLTLPLSAGLVVVTDHLGAAGAPYRDPGTNTGYNGLYADSRRGDAGARERTLLSFQLDLRAYNRSGIQRVLIQGTDPLRGFNVNDETPATADFATAPVMTWLKAGITMYDDGSHGDTNAGDGVYYASWAMTTNGYDSTYEPDLPNSLVGAGEFDAPYYGDSFWATRRSPRSFGYKFYVYTLDGNGLESPAANIEYYLEDAAATNVVMPLFAWENNALPPPPPSNSPTALSMAFTNGAAILTFTNLPGESAHGVQISTNLLQSWLDYGHRAALAGGLWRATISNLTAAEMYRPFAGPAQAFQGVRFDPNPVPSTGGILRVYYNQHSRGLPGDRNVQIAGTFSTWNPQPMTFVSNGIWFVDAVISDVAATNIEFKPRNLSGSQWEGMGGGGENYRAYKGYGRATWSPNSPTNQEILTITYDQAGGPLAAATNINAYVGFEEQWYDAGNRAMTNIGATTWEIAFPVPTGRVLSVNFVFNNGATWDSESSGGRLNRAFIGPAP